MYVCMYVEYLYLRHAFNCLRGLTTLLVIAHAQPYVCEPTLAIHVHVCLCMCIYLTLLHTYQGPAPSKTVILSMLLLIVGAVVAGVNDLSGTRSGYLWMLAHVASNVR